MPAPEAAGAHPARRQGAGGDGPFASLRDYFDSGPCPAMPMRGGAGERSGAPMRRNPSIFFWTVRLKPHDRNRLHARATHPEPQGVRRARGRSGGQRYRSTKRSKRKNSGIDTITRRTP